MIFTVSLTIDDSAIGLTNKDIKTRMRWLSLDIGEAFDEYSYIVTHVAIEHQDRDGHITKYPPKRAE